MKRCPECRRDYYDDSLLYCLDDGVALLEGPAFGDEHATAVFPVLPTAGPGDVRTQLYSTEPESRPKTSFDKRLILAPFLLAAIVLAGFGVYRYKAASSEGETIRSIAVLPFQNRNSDADTEYLSDGLAESLIYRLSQIPELKVSPRSSVFRYKGQDADAERVGNELGVDAVMSGRLIQRGDNLTISVDLVDVRNKKTIWGEQYDRKMADLMATQREIAATITDKLQLKLGGHAPTGITKQYTNSNEAYQLWMKARFYWNRRTNENNLKAIDFLKQATEKDPNFALAYAGLADCYVVHSTYSGLPASETMPLAKSYANKAIQLDPTLAEPHAALGLATWFLDWNREESEREFKRALELNPNYGTAHHWYSRYLRSIGQFEEGYREIKRAEELDPLSLIFINNVAEAEMRLGNIDAADKTCQRMIDMDPNFWAIYQTLGWLRTKQGRFDEALAAAQKGVELSNRASTPIAQLGHAYARLGRKDEAMATIRELEQRFSEKKADGRDIAVVYAGLNDKDKGFEWLEKAYQQRSFFLISLNMEMQLDSLHDDPRWGDLKRRIGLPN